MTERLRLPLDGETALATALDDALVLIAGVGPALPAAVTALINGDPAASVEAVTVSWPRGGADHAAGFVALVPFVRSPRLRLGSVVLRPPRGALRYALPRRAVTFEACLQAVAADAGEGFAAVVGGLMDTLLALPESPRRTRAFAALAQAAAPAEGIVEMVGDLGGGELYLQGWSAELAQGVSRVVALAERPVAAVLTAAVFAREDLQGRAHGFAGLLAAPGIADHGALQRLYVRTGGGWRAVNVYDRRVLLAERETPAHARAILSRARGSSEVLAALQGAAHRYDGRETVSQLALPVRIGVDMVSAVEGGGLFASGWLLDPEGHVEGVTVRGPGYEARLDAGWSRRPRPDVTQAFAAEPLFAGRLPQDSHMHGFLGVAARAAPDAPLHLEIALRGRHPAYVPLAASRAPAGRALSRLVASLDPQVTAAGVLEQQFAPLIQAIERPGPRAAAPIDSGTFDAGAATALVVGVDETADVGVLLALLALDPDTRAASMVVSCPRPVADRVAGDVRRLAAFYGLNLRFVAADGAEDVCDALEAGVQATRAETLVFLSAAVMPTARGWLSRLERAHRARGGRAAVSPTILFEDDSVRWAGTWIDGEGGDRALVDRYVGYPRATLAGAEATEVTAATMECCILQRAAFQGAGGFTSGYLGTAAKSLDFGLKLKLAGTPSVWLPDVEMVAAEEGAGSGPPHWGPFARRVDRLAFDRRWSLAIANLGS